MKIRTGVAAAAVAAVVASAPVGMGPARATETCHPPNYNTVYCACVAMVRALSPVIPPENWDCNPS